MSKRKQTDEVLEKSKYPLLVSFFLKKKLTLPRIRIDKTIDEEGTPERW